MTVGKHVKKAHTQNLHKEILKANKINKFWLK